MSEKDAELKLQAFLDGELPPAEAAEVKAWLEGDADGRLLLAELQNTCGALAGHEAEIKLPESREFYWSKIEREIRRQEKPEVAAAAREWSWTTWLRRLALPLSGMAVLTLALVVALQPAHPLAVVRPVTVAEADGDEMEMTTDDMDATTYRDDDNKVTLVWFSDRSASSQFTEAHPAGSVDPR
jgi:anti-sigma factor RsiW